MQYGSNNYSLLGDLRDRQLTTSYQDQNPQMDTMADLNRSATPNWQNAAAQGAVQGGASGSLGGTLMGAGLGAALTPGAFEAGLMSAGTGGLGVAGAGLILSQLEQKQKAKAMQEQAIAEEANNRKQQTMAALNNLMNQRVSVA